MHSLYILLLALSLLHGASATHLGWGYPYQCCCKSEYDQGGAVSYTWAGFNNGNPACYWGPGAPGAWCAQAAGNNGCIHGVCNAGVCATCTADSDCPTNGRCAAVTGACVTGDNSDYCDDNGDCSSGCCDVTGAYQQCVPGPCSQKNNGKPRGPYGADINKMKPTMGPTTSMSPSLSPSEAASGAGAVVVPVMIPVAVPVMVPVAAPLTAKTPKKSKKAKSPSKGSKLTAFQSSKQRVGSMRVQDKSALPPP